MEVTDGRFGKDGMADRCSRLLMVFQRWRGLVNDDVGMVQFLGSDDGVLVGVVGFTEGSEVCRIRKRFPFVFQFAAGFLEEFGSRSEPRV